MGCNFSFGVIDNSNLLQEAFRLRYQVYCHECNFIQEKDYPEGFEKDEYDPYSIEFFAQDSEMLIGTSRLILDSPLGFPLEEHCKNNLFIDKNSLPRNNCAEISRLVISKKCLSKRVKAEIYEKKSLAQNSDNLMPYLTPLTIGIFREMYQECERRGIDYVYALMERPLFMLLKRRGFAFNPIGEEVDFYGPVRPYLGVVETLGERILQKLPRFSKISGQQCISPLALHYSTANNL